MCVMCLAAQRSFDECAEATRDQEPHALGGGGTGGGASVVNDHSSILYYLGGDDNFRWNAESDVGSSVLVTYSFNDGSDLPSTSGALDNPFGASNFSSFTEPQKNNFRLAAAEFMAVSGIVLVEVSGDADIGVFNAHGTGVGGYADLPYVSGSYQSEVELVVDSWGDYAPGSYGYFTILHELGHALGLEHTHEGAYQLASALDSTAHSVMSYNYDGTAQGLQALDVAALKHLYGDQAVSGGWSFSQGSAAARLDANGSQGSDVFIAPAPVNKAAFATKIKGYDGDDWITGQNASDILRGNKGHDTLDGLSGNDKLRGGGDNDTIYGGAGDDFLHGGSGDDSVFGQSGNDTIIGGSGSDRLSGGEGNDNLSGRLNADTLSAGAGNDTLDGGGGDDVLSGGGGTDLFIFQTGSGHDRITDFDANAEIIRFVGTGLSFADVLVADVGGHAQITLGGSVIDLTDVSAASIGADDFQFV